MKKYIKYVVVAVNIALLLKFKSIYGCGRLPFCLDMAILSYVYFLIGGGIYHSENQVYNTIKRCFLIIIFLYVLLGSFVFWDISGLGAIARCVMTVLSPILAWFVAKFLIEEKKIMPNKLTNEINRLSFGIYIIQSWLIIPILHIPFVAPFMSDHYLVFPIVNFLFLLFISIVIANIAYRTKIGRFLFAG